MWMMLLQYLGSSLWVLSMLLITFILLCGFINALNFTKLTPGSQRWIAVGPFFTWLVGAITAIVLIWNSSAMARIVGRLADLVGLFEEISLLHATSCMMLIIVTTVRAFFVISEMDNGRYAGKTEVPGLIAASLSFHVSEAIVRLFILVFLTIFAGAFLRMVMPTGSLDFRLTGSPAIFSELTRACLDYKGLVMSQGLGFEMEKCLTDAIANLPSVGPGQSLASLTQVMIDPIRWLLQPAYIFMGIWTLIVWIKCKDSVADKSTFSRACVTQLAISLTALSSVALMSWWVDVAVSRKIMGVTVSAEAVRTWLLAMSLVGITTSLLCFIVLSKRMVRSDTVLIRELFRRFWNSSPVIP
jgi:hypothetical protein